MNDKAYDVIVVGAGNAALCAALSAREQGAKVLVLERAPLEKRGGNTAFAGGVFRTVYNGLEDVLRFIPDTSEDQIANTDFGSYSADEYFDDLYRVTHHRIDPDLAEVLVRSSHETLGWIQSKGIRFIAHYGFNALKHEGRFKFFGGQIFEAVGGGRGLSDAEFKAAEKRGIVVRYATRASALIEGRGGIEGVRVITDRVAEDIRAPAVVLACGGFEANREWRTRYLGPGWDLAKVRGSSYNTGDGIGMALAIGAQPAGHWSGAHACAWDLNSPEFGDLDIGDRYSKHGYTSGVVLNANGLRFMDEGEDFFNMTYAKYGRVILEQPGQSAWQVFDSKVLHLLDPRYRTRQVTKVTANTLEELAAKLEGVNQRQALQTLREYNAAVNPGARFNPTVLDGCSTSGLAIPKSNWALALDTPPFEAFAVTCGITFTFGGLKISTDAEVIDMEHKAIPGLYAAGELVGGVFYFNYPGGAGLMNGAVFGRRAGQNAARHAGSR